MEKDALDSIMTDLQKNTASIIVTHLEDLLKRLQNTKGTSYSYGVKDGIQAAINMVNGIRKKIRAAKTRLRNILMYTLATKNQ